MILCAVSSVAPAVDPVCRIAITSPGTAPVTFEVELALTPEEQARGLMERLTLPAGRGMLFDFGTERAVAMWMKNTYLPLDLGFFDARGVLRHVARDTEPLSLALIRAPMPIRYVLEVNAGETGFMDATRGASFDPSTLQDCARDAPGGSSR